MLKAKEESLDEMLTCHVCKKYYLNPITLPCGNSICKNHIDQNAADYKCLICTNKHVVPADGFVISKTIFRILQIKSHLDDKTKSLHKIIDDFDTVVKELSLLCKDPENFIFDYVSATRFKIDLEREKLIERIHSISDEMLSKLKVLETDAKANVKNINDLLDRNQLEIDKLEQLSEKWKEELRTPKLDQKRVDEMIDETREYLTENQHKSFEYKNKVLSGKGCYFDPKFLQFNNDSFGQLVLDKFEITNMFENKLTAIINPFESTILTYSLSHDLINLCEFDLKRKYKLIYRATRDGFEAKEFHEKCDNITKTLFIIKVKDSPNIFGGYTECGWDSSCSWKKDENAFIFSLINKDNNPIRMKSRDQYSICCSSVTHIIFGFNRGDNNLQIKTKTNDTDIQCSGTSNLGTTFAHPTYLLDSNEAKTFLAGTYEFIPSEIEIFKVE